MCFHITVHSISKESNAQVYETLSEIVIFVEHCREMRGNDTLHQLLRVVSFIKKHIRVSKRVFNLL